MTKKKKTLRAAVLASIFAMAFSATAWGATYGTVDVDGYDYTNDIAKTATPYSGVMYDGGWYAPDGKFYTYVDANGNVGIDSVLVRISVSFQLLAELLISDVHLVEANNQTSIGMIAGNGYLIFPNVNIVFAKMIDKYAFLFLHFRVNYVK